MITVNLLKDPESRRLTLTLSGHAGAAEIGHDIVCAGASILACTVAQEAKNMEKRNQLSKPPVIRMKEGDTEIEVCPLDEGDWLDALHTFYIAQVGYKLLAHNYPQYVELKQLTKADSQP